MYVSMTGFSRTQIQRSWGTVSLEVSSVNHRYQEIYVRLPREFSSWEPWFHQKLRKGFRRGKVQVRMDVLWASSFEMGRINKDIMTSYCEELMQIQRMLGQAKDLQLESVVTLPGVLDIPRFEESAEAEELEASFSELIELGLSSWQEMRETEGEHLKEEVLTHLAELERLSALIEEKWLPARDQAFETTRLRITEMLDTLGGKLEESRMMQEIVVMTDKWDVSEEIARLKSHISKFRSTGEDAESSGRKLDFIVQEMNREVNTLDSKISDAEIRWLAVDSKAALERIREQIQNLE
ncbi:MAG: YicC/YloC family endoribonuclease [Synergistaceae bacterium]|nr:YicC/YloC family endoribonuclease [Synergistaceae bacterium]